MPMAFQRCDGQLDEVDARQQIVVVLQFQRVQHVFTIVQDDARKGLGLLRVLRKDGLHDPVQAVRLAGRPVMRHFHADQLAVSAPHPLYFVDRALIVLVGAGEDHVVLVFQRRHHGLKHRRDHVVLQPGGHHDRQRLFRFGAQVFGRQGRVAALDRQRTPQLPQPVPGVDEQVVQAGKQDDDADDGGHHFQPAVIVRDEVGPVKGRHGGRPGRLTWCPWSSCDSPAGQGSGPGSGPATRR
ncbi:hypothetical protein D3C71_1254100 [compost metagenome]